MKGDTGPAGSGGGGERPRNPYPLPGQNWDSPEDDPREDDVREDDPSAGPAGVSLTKGARPPLFLPRPARPERSELKVWMTFLVPFAVAIVAIFGWGSYQFYDSVNASDGEDASTSSRPEPTPPSTPEPEPVSTVPPKVKGWKAVSSGKYGLTYDVPPSWRVLSSGTLLGYEGIGGGKPVAMSSAAVFREDACTDGDDEYDRGDTGFNQYVEGGTAEVASHAARKWATHAYNVEGSPAPAVTLGEPEAVKVGRAKAVHVRADVVLKARGKCLSPTAVVHTVAVPGVGPGKTTVFVLLSDRGVPDAAPRAEIGKILRSLRPS